MKLASIIIPTWNRKKLVAEAAESALAQTYRPLEIVVVDDGSTDGTRELLEELSRKSTEDVSIRFFPRPHLGVSAARQHGLEMARGEYVQFLDSDDLLLPEKLKKQIVEMEQFQAVCSLCLAYKGCGNIAPDDLKRSSFSLVGNVVRSGREALALLSTGMPFAIHTSTMLWRRDFLAQQRPWPEEYCNSEDLIYFARLFVSGEIRRISFVDEPLAVIRDHDGSRATVSPRLHGWRDVNEGEIATRKSSLLGRAEMVRELQKAKGWCFDWERGCARQLRAGYWDALHVLQSEELRKYERLCLSLSSRFSALSMLVLARRVFGRWAPSTILHEYLSARFRRQNVGSGCKT